jgi:RHS repeat-associated protein
MATLSLSGSGAGWNIANERSYDVWGLVRSGATTGGPKGRYVAHLGHVQDDESGLIYMRARYYEPESGRFISEDPAMDGSNWFTYCANDPVNFGDYSGKERIWLQIGDFEVSFDWYTPNGSSDVMGDIHWRPIGNKAKDGLGSISSDGTGKHGMDMPNN